jgi:hypothetical protein
MVPLLDVFAIDPKSGTHWLAAANNLKEAQEIILRPAVSITNTSFIRK